MKKKMISLVLAVAMVIGLCPSAFATEVGEGEITVTNVGSGEYILANELVRGNDSYSAKSADPSDDIYYIEDIDQFIMKVDDDRFLATSQNVLAISDIAEVDNLDVPIEVKEAILRDIELYGKADGVLYTPVVNTMTRANPEISNYTYNGYKMTQYLYSGNDSCGFTTIATGIDTGKTARTIMDLVVTVGGKSLGAIGITISGISLFQDAMDALGLGNITTGMGKDYLQINAAWKKYEKFTYFFDPGIDATRLGTVTEKVIVNKVYSCQYYQATGKLEVKTEKSLNKTFVSPNYNSPNSLAISCVMEPHLENDMIGNIGGLAILF